MRKKRILLFSEGFGAGHTQAAHSLAVGLRHLDPTIKTKVVELGSFLHPTIAPWVFSMYRKTVTFQPKLYGALYRSQYKKSLNKFTQLALHRIFYSQAAEVIRQLRPDAIVCTHPFPSAVVSRLKRFGLDIPLYTVITDYDAHGTWVTPEVNKYLVSTDDVKLKLLRRGVPLCNIEVTGIPVHPNFWNSHNKEEIRRQFFLKPLPTALIMGGGWGLLSNEKLLEDVVKWRDQMQLIFCLGNNLKALAKLSEHPSFQHENIRLMGFTREIDKLMDVSDLLITKPGGMTCTEGLAKGIPMLFYDPIPGQEEENVQYFTDQGFGEKITSAETIDRWFSHLLDRYPEMSGRQSSPESRLYKPAECSQMILDCLSTPNWTSDVMFR